MKKKVNKRPGLPILAMYAKGEREKLKHWSAIIDQDDDCRETVSLLERLYRMFEACESAGMGQATGKLAERIFEHSLASRDRKGRSAGRLFYDSRVIPLPAGIRPSLMSERRLKYIVDAGVLELSVVPVFPGRFAMTGRLEGYGPDEKISARLIGRRTLRADTDEFGFFSFAAIDPGKYKLDLQIGGKETVIHGLELR